MALLILVNISWKQLSWSNSFPPQTHLQNKLQAPLLPVENSHPAALCTFHVTERSQIDKSSYQSLNSVLFLHLLSKLLEAGL